MKRVLLLAAVLYPLSWTAGAQDYGRGLQAFDRGDFLAAFLEWRPLAEQGDATVQRILGTMYREGHGIPQDYAEAVKWFRKAAEQGDRDAQRSLGFMYHTGQGVPQDYSASINWYRKAAEQGLADAQYNLGVMYATGKGAAQDYAEAYIWYSLAAASGYKAAPEWRYKMATKLTPGQLRDAQRAATRRWERIQVRTN